MPQPCPAVSPDQRNFTLRLWVGAVWNLPASGAERPAVLWSPSKLTR